MVNLWPKALTYTWIVSFFQNKIHLHSHQKIRNVFLSNGFTSGKNNRWDSAELWSAPAGVPSFISLFFNMQTTLLVSHSYTLKEKINQAGGVLVMLK